MRFLNHLLNEESKGLGLTFFDMDETLFYTYAKVIVKKGNEIIKKLSNAEFNAYKLKEGEEFDFSEFRSAKLFSDTSKPIGKIMAKFLAILKNAEPKGSKVMILTARQDFDDKELFLDKLKKEGIPVEKTYVIRAGNRKGDDVSIMKKTIVKEYLANGLYRRARLFDDYLKNCTQFLSLQNDIPKEIIDKIRQVNEIPDEIPDEKIITFEAYHVQEDGSVRRVK